MSLSPHPATPSSGPPPTVTDADRRPPQLAEPSRAEYRAWVTVSGLSAERPDDWEPVIEWMEAEHDDLAPIISWSEDADVCFALSTDSASIVSAARTMYDVVAAALIATEHREYPTRVEIEPVTSTAGAAATLH